MKAERYFRKSTIGLVSICLINILLLLQSAQAQDIKKSNPNKPDVRVKVNKEFDDKGNLTRYDSTYSYSWSGSGQVPINADSIFGKSNGSLWFGNDSAFNHTFFFNDNQLNEILKFYSRQGLLPDNDSLESSRYKDFFKHHQAFADPFFDVDPFNSFEKQLEEMMKQKQDIMDQFFNQRPELKKSQKDTIQQAPTQRQQNLHYKQSKNGVVWI